MEKRVLSYFRYIALLAMTFVVPSAIASDIGNHDSHHCSTAVKLSGHVPDAVKNNCQCLECLDADECIPITFVLPLRNQEDLETLIQQIYDVNNKDSYGKYLSVEEFNKRFAPTQDDYDKVIAHAQEMGLEVVGMHENRMLLNTKGVVASIQSGFNVHLHTYQQPNGSQFYASDDDPEVPSHIANAIGGIIGLDNFSRGRRYSSVSMEKNQVEDENPVVSSNLRFPSGPGGGVSPMDLRRAYNLSSVNRRGAGQKIGIFAMGGCQVSDIQVYAAQFGMPIPNLVEILVDGGSGDSKNLETTLDVQMALALAPESQVYIYHGRNNVQGILNTYNRIASDNIVKQVSTSWGWVERAPGLIVLNAENAIFQQMAAQGQTMYAASGDKGAYDLYPNMELSIQDPGSQPYVVGVGGTTLAFNNSTGNYGSEIVWNYGPGWSSGGGVSNIWPIPSWQKDILTTYSKTHRNTPDVSLNADDYCIYYLGQWILAYGTSAAAPLWASFTALVNEQRQAVGLPSLGFANPIFYKVGKLSTQGASPFYDITSGDNLFYSASKGYDNATGWGSFNGANLLAVLSSIPNVAISINSTNSVVAGNVNVTINATDSLIGIERVDFYIDSQLIKTSTTTPYGVDVNTSTLEEGSHVFKAVGYNVIGSFSSATKSVTVHNGAPSVDFVTPVNNSHVAGTINIQANAVDSVAGIDRVEFYVDSTLIGQAAAAPYEVSFNTGVFSDGPHTLKGVAYNSLGTSASTIQSVSIYNTAPSVNFVTPVNNIHVAGTVNIQANAVDSVVGMARVEFYVDSTLIGTATDAPYAVSLNTKEFSDGSHTLKAVAYNRLGTSASTIQSVSIYNTAPSVSFAVPENNAKIAGVFNITANGVDSVVGMAQVEFYVDSTLIGTATDAPYAVSLNTKEFSDGSHTLKAVAYNRLGTSASTIQNVSIYNTAPSVSFTVPENNAKIAGVFNVTANGVDSVVGMARVEFYVDSTLIGTATDAPYAVSLNTKEFSDGSHTLKAVAYNRLGTSASAIQNVSIYNTAPVVTFTSPAKDSKVAGQVSLGAKVASSPVGITRVEFYVDSKLVGTSTVSPYVVKLDTRKVADGLRVLKAVAYNSLGVSGATSQNVTIYNKPPTLSLALSPNTREVTGILKISAKATDVMGIARVDFFAGSLLIGTDTSAPYGAQIDTTTLPNGSCSIKAVAYNKLGTMASAIVNVIIANPLPSVIFTAPKNGSSVTGVINLAANIVDPAAIQRVEYYVDSVLYESTSAAPFQVKLDTSKLSKGKHNLTVIVYNYKGTSSKEAIIITVI